MSTKKHTIYVINTNDSGKSYWNSMGSRRSYDRRIREIVLLPNGEPTDLSAPPHSAFHDRNPNAPSRF